MRRCIHEMLLCVLEELEREEKTVTELAYECRLDTRSMRRIKKILREAGLAEELAYNHRRILRLTDRGRMVLECLKKIFEIVKT
ncbi:MAG: hypothetical protein GXO26_08350 [Crenarchaeota archaeon]|nr:hypothetical protein [Thermoproteota archaeon]